MLWLTILNNIGGATDCKYHLLKSATYKNGVKIDFEDRRRLNINIFLSIRSYHFSKDLLLHYKQIVDLITSLLILLALMPACPKCKTKLWNSKFSRKHPFILAIISEILLSVKL